MHRARSVSWARGLGLPGALLVCATSSWEAVDAAGASATARVSVVEAISVPGILGAPISVNDVLLALQSSAAGPATGSRLIRLINAVAPADPSNLSVSDPGVSPAMAGALGVPDSAGTLEGDRAASVSLKGSAGEAPVSITVAFN
jgi:hypothetical protein